MKPSPTVLLIIVMFIASPVVWSGSGDHHQTGHSTSQPATTAKSDEKKRIPLSLEEELQAEENEIDRLLNSPSQNARDRGMWRLHILLQKHPNSVGKRWLELANDAPKGMCVISKINDLGTISERIAQGTLIGDRIITSAHVLDSKGNEKIHEIRCSGGVVITSNDIQGLYSHPRYNSKDSGLTTGDVGVILLKNHYESDFFLDGINTDPKWTEAVANASKSKDSLKWCRFMTIPDIQMEIPLKFPTTGVIPHGCDDPECELNKHLVTCGPIFQTFPGDSGGALFQKIEMGDSTKYVLRGVVKAAAPVESQPTMLERLLKPLSISTQYPKETLSVFELTATHSEFFRDPARFIRDDQARNPRMLILDLP